MKGNCTTVARYNGATWDVISNRTSVTGPQRDRASIDQPLTLDCGGTENGYQKKNVGTKMAGDITIDVVWDPETASNAHNHDLLEVDWAAGNAAVWRITYPDTVGSGFLVEATVKTLGEPQCTPDEDVVVTFTLQPTGRWILLEDDVDSNDLSGAPASVATTPAPIS